jgi:hypothetical protein
VVEDLTLTLLDLQPEAYVVRAKDQPTSMETLFWMEELQDFPLLVSLLERQQVEVMATPTKLVLLED